MTSNLTTRIEQAEAGETHVRACCGIPFGAKHLERCEFFKPPRQCPAVTHVWCHAPRQCGDPCPAGFSRAAALKAKEQNDGD